MHAIEHARQHGMACTCTSFGWQNCDSMGLPRWIGGVPGGEPLGALMRPLGPSHQHMAMSSSQMPAGTGKLWRVHVELAPDRPHACLSLSDRRLTILPSNVDPVVMPGPITHISYNTYRYLIH